MKMKLFALPFILLISFSVCAAGTPEVVWEKYFDGPESELMQNIEHSPDGGFILCGNVITVDSIKNDRPFTSSIPFLTKTDSAGNPIWYHYYGGFWEDRGERASLNILSVADTGFVIGGSRIRSSSKRNEPVVVCAYEDGSLKDLPSSLYHDFKQKDTIAVSFFSWEISKEYRPERVEGGGPRIIDSLDYKFMWRGANREPIRERTITLQSRPVKYHQWESGEIVILCIARKPVTTIPTGINAILWLNADGTTKWMRYYHDPDENHFYPNGELVCTPDQRVFVFSNPRHGMWETGFHILEIDSADGEILFSQGFDKERMHVADYLALPNNEFILTGTIFQMMPDGNHIDYRHNDYYLMKLRIP